MDLSKGTRFGPYEIVGLIGKGGMGEVYRAQDTRLDRTVAIKVLSETDPQRQQRFKREAKAVSSLNHPHICTLHDVGEERGTHFLVMEFLAGETLAERMHKGRLPLHQALEFAIQIADALEKAHRQGVVHRDLKPGNIMITKSGVKLLDFGLAKLNDHVTPSSILSALPTRHSAPLTQEGTILGTLQYMAPEQLEGAAIDARADIFAFGAVLYEMVTGKKAFEGKSQASLIGAIMHSDPKPIAEFEKSSPAALDHIVRRCLAKDPDDRWQSAGDLRHELMWIAQGERSGAIVLPLTQSHRVRSSKQAALWTLAGMVASGLLVGLVTWKAAQPGDVPPRPLRQFAITPATSLLASAGSLLGLSPSGDTLVYVGFPQSGGRQLYRHSMDQVDDAPIPGTDWGQTTTAGQSAAPFFSPDGKWVAFTSRGTLKKVLLSGGPSVTVADVLYRGGSWGRDDEIVLGGGPAGLLRVSAKGGIPTPIVTPKPNEGSFVYPQLLPGGDAVLFTVSPEPLTGHLEILMVKAGERRRLIDGLAGRVVPSGHLVFFRGGSIWAVRFDFSRLATVGEAVRVVEGVRSEIEGSFQFDVSDDGSLAYIPDPGAAVDRTLVWVDQKGQEQPTKAQPANYAWARVSPDGKQVAVQIGDRDSADIGVVDVETGFLNRLTDRVGLDAYPVWTRDGQRIVYASERAGAIELLSTTPDGTGEIERLAVFKDALIVQPQGWSADGMQLVFLYIKGGSVDIWQLRVDGKSMPEPLLNGNAVEQTPAISPNGNWIAYSSNEAGRTEVFIQRYPGLGQKHLISTGGGLDPMWSPDGMRLYYHAFPPTKMMVASIDPNIGARAGEAQVLFERQYYRPLPGTRTHSISKDGMRLLMIKSAKPSTTPDRIHIMVNWFDELRRLLPDRN